MEIKVSKVAKTKKDVKIYINKNQMIKGDICAK